MIWLLITAVYLYMEQVYRKLDFRSPLYMAEVFGKLSFLRNISHFTGQYFLNQIVQCPFFYFQSICIQKWTVVCKKKMEFSYLGILNENYTFTFPGGNICVFCDTCLRNIQSKSDIYKN